MAKTYRDLVNEIESKRDADLFARMDQDRDLVNMTQYIMKDNQNPPQPVPDIVNVTLNMPAYMATTILTDIGSATEQVAVLPQKPNFDSAYVEDFIKACFAAADDRNTAMGRIPLNTFTDGQLCLRGRAARRVLFRFENGKLIPDISQWDTRFVSYEYGADGLKWAAYHMKKTKDQIMAQYGLDIKNDTADVLDVWDTEKNEIWVDSTQQKEEKHFYGFTPVVLEIVSLGSGGILLDADNRASEGESIFFMIRHIVPELNRLASIMQTLNLKSVKPPGKWESDEGAQATPPEYEDVMGMGTMTSAPKGGGQSIINFGDAQRSAQIAYQMFQNAFEAGGMTAAELGILGKPPASGVALLIAGEGRDRIYHPRLIAKGNLNAATARMILRQVRQQFQGEVAVGWPEPEATFNTAKLEGQYSIEFNYTVKSQEVDAGRASLAAAYGRLLSERTKRAEILQREDPEGDEDLIRAEAAEYMSPMIRMYKSIQSLKKLDRDFEAELLAAEFEQQLNQMLMGQTTQQKEEKMPEPKQVISLFGGTGGRIVGGEQNQEEMG